MTTQYHVIQLSIITPQHNRQYGDSAASKYIHINYFNHEEYILITLDIFILCTMLAFHKVVSRALVFPKISRRLSTEVFWCVGVLSVGANELCSHKKSEKN